MRQYTPIHVVTVLCIFLLTQIFLSAAFSVETARTTLRSAHKLLSVSQVQSMPHIHIRMKKEWGFYGHSEIGHEYELNTIGSDKVVLDNATGLMWHQSGSSDYMVWKDVRKWIWGLNRSKYAGYNDWRLPTVEEAASLLEPEEKNGTLYIDAVFDEKHRWLWTGDKSASGGIWRVYFDGGYVDWGDAGLLYVRPVRTIK